MKIFGDLGKILSINVPKEQENIEITGVTADSREVKEGDLFICLLGGNVNGHDYIDTAISRGAKAVLVCQEVAVPEGIGVLKVDETRSAMKVLVPYFYDYPARKLRMIGVTGTNGKTTVTHIIRHLLNKAGYKTGVIGTVHILIEDNSYPIKNTTPDVVELQQTLAKMVEVGVTHCLMEVSSHALALGRVVSVEYDTAIFTNLTQDHLDFHKTFDNYFAAKSKLFETLGKGDIVKEPKTAIVNIDDPYGTKVLAKTDAFTMTYGVKGGALQAVDVHLGAKETTFTLLCYGQSYEVHTTNTGMFNVYNTLAAIGAGIAEGLPIETIIEALKSFNAVPGRFEAIEEGQDFAVIVDYAHTPDGLANVLFTAKELVDNKIIVVFGCGGDRDSTKRPIMGRIAAELGQHIIITSDNPRSENPESIIKEIEGGVLKGLLEGDTYEIIVDREEAIYEAIRKAQKGDMVMIVGKGHEDYQVLKDRTIHFDDREVARKALKER